MLALGGLGVAQACTSVGMSWRSCERVVYGRPAMIEQGGYPGRPLGLSPCEPPGDSNKAGPLVQKTFVGLTCARTGCEQHPTRWGNAITCNPVPFPPPTQLGCVLWKGAPNKTRTSADPQRARPLLNGLHCREILNTVRVGRFDSPVMRRAGPPDTSVFLFLLRRQALRGSGPRTCPPREVSDG